MDALEILTDLDNVFPYFQPIFSADEHRVIGYEVFGRYRGEEGVISLGPFFLDEGIPEEYRLEVDHVILKKALDKLIALDEDVLLFINKDADLLMYDNADSFLALMLEYQDKGIKLDRIILESTERVYKGNMEHLDHLMNYLRTYGIKVAIDNMGNERSHLDRIGQLAPNIIKVDLNELRSTASAHVLHDILYTLSLLARKIGATLLFKNIEMDYQLQFAWRNGGRYYQGYYLHKPNEDFIDRDFMKEKLREKCHQYISYEKKKLEALHVITEKFNDHISQFLQKNRKGLEYEELIKLLSQFLDQVAFRLYICDENGFQKSANIFKNNQSWMIQKQYLDKNWSWRPYFLENIMKMRVDKRGILSDLYSDIETGETIRTFSYPLNDSDYLFVDLSYEYLYEREGLL
ncbi:EAL domain-containing protein (putative c-di-GMP-specific phosphodiesterase class I) [Cytobacillus eiseniae]|uniref:EAL domain-containing protein (Putative c-di-GMP-specific phosphodiesterase class I) n=1 Tax=Cytobacillus eiseniae TaxID=762947 RepID=A0ABS4RAN7_9BACI|nr:EAL domain-containing protein [Cytobacillus eiseniae]MBP2239946.1 EAL domain-containing protein (putative c-di-GMP-specific phosphodiesterase class I) [Cytobacillus eiseniae]